MVSEADKPKPDKITGILDGHRIKVGSSICEICGEKEEARATVLVCGLLLQCFILQIEVERYDNVGHNDKIMMTMIAVICKSI